MARKEMLKGVLIEDIHIQLKKENRARSINKAQSEMLISEQEREMQTLKRKSKKMKFDTYQEMSTFFGEKDGDTI